MIRMATGGVPRRLTFDLMREMRRLIYHSIGAQPDEIRCPQRQLEAYEQLFPERERRLANEAEFKGHSWDGIPMLFDESLAADCIQWRRGGEPVGVIADLWTSELSTRDPIEVATRRQPTGADGRIRFTFEVSMDEAFAMSVQPHALGQGLFEALHASLRKAMESCRG